MSQDVTGQTTSSIGKIMPITAFTCQQVRQPTTNSFWPTKHSLLRKMWPGLLHDHARIAAASSSTSTVAYTPGRNARRMRQCNVRSQSLACQSSSSSWSGHCWVWNSCRGLLSSCTSLSAGLGKQPRSRYFVYMLVQRQRAVQSNALHCNALLCIRTP